MTQKFLYIVDHFCVFPVSEYGGLWNVVAENDNDCFDLIVEHDEGFNQSSYVTLREKVLNARKFALLEDEQSRVVEAFYT